MTDDHDQPGDQTPPDVGSVAEEAMKLFGALADVAREHGADAAGGLGGMADQAAAWGREINDHIATGSEDCRYCPVCRVVHAVRETSPDVRAHLTVAASSLLQAAAGLLETLPQPPTSGSGDQAERTGQAGQARPAGPSSDTRPRGAAVERIDLEQSSADSDEDGEW